MMKKSVGILMALLLVVLCFGAAGEAAVSSDEVTLTVTPSSNLLLYQGVTYAISAKDATNVSLVFVEGEYEDEIRLDEFMQPDEYGIWFLDWSSYYRGEIGVYAKASFDDGVTWVSCETQTLNFVVKGESSFDAVADSDVVAKGEPIVIRFSNLDMVAFISPPILYKITEGEDPVDMPDFTDLVMEQSEMTCETADLEAGTYWFEFFGAPSEDGYTECRVVVEVTITE